MNIKEKKILLRLLKILNAKVIYTEKHMNRAFSYKKKYNIKNEFFKDTNNSIINNNIKFRSKTFNNVN